MSRSRLTPILIVLAVAALWGSAIRPVWTLDPDAAAYLTLGRNLAAGEGYVLDGLPHTKYPPGLPVVLGALAIVTGPEAYGLFHGALVLAVALGAAGCLALGRRLGLGGSAALVLALATGLSVPLFELAVTYLRTEPLFLALGLGAWLAIDRALDARGTRGMAILAGLLTGAALLTRLAGVTLLVAPALALVLGWRAVGSRGHRADATAAADGPPDEDPGRSGTEAGDGPLPAQDERTSSSPRLRAALILALGGLALVAWMGRGQLVRAAHPEAPDYASEFLAAEPRDLTKVVRTDNPRLDGAALVRRVGGNLEVLARSCAVLLGNVDAARSKLPIGLAALALVLAGLLASLRDRGDHAASRRHAALYVLATLGLYLIWPFNQQERFYLPLLPFLLVFAGFGVHLALTAAGAVGRHRAGAAALMLAALAALVVLFLQRSDAPRFLGRYSTTYAAMLLAATLAVGALGAGLARGRLALPPSGLVLVPLLFALTFARARFVQWPYTVEAFEARRTAEPRDGTLARIDVHPVLEEVGVWLAANTPPDAVVMTDVPKMLTVLSGRRCIPFVYTLDPPAVDPAGADLVFYTREIDEAAAVMDAVTPDWQPAHVCEPIEIMPGVVLEPTVWRAP